MTVYYRLKTHAQQGLEVDLGGEGCIDYRWDKATSATGTASAAKVTTTDRFD